jgi:hypothetical protein
MPEFFTNDDLEEVLRREHVGPLYQRGGFRRPPGGSWQTRQFPAGGPPRVTGAARGQGISFRFGEVQ